MVDFYDELIEGDIHLRDKFQFELKSEYLPHPSLERNTYTLEFFFFIPAALQINRDTYTKEQFYYDQTNFIRLKTPGLSFQELIDASQERSPLHRIKVLYQSTSPVDEERVIEELKLYANIVRSAIRNRVRDFLDELKRANGNGPEAFLTIGREVVRFCEESQALRRTFLKWQEEMNARWQQGRLSEYCRYIDEFVSSVSERYSAGLLQDLAMRNRPELLPAQEALAELIAWESTHRAQRHERSPFADDPERRWEYTVYRGGLLKKFVFEALFLSLTRKEPMKTLQQVMAAVAAGLAMLFYVLFLSFYSVNPVWDSTAFIVLSVLLYVLKDRLKEGIKNISSKLAVGWFPDYRTQIRTPNDQILLGYLNEYFMFLPPSKVPPEILEIRNTRFHTELEKARRMETLLYFKKEVTLLPQLVKQGDYIYELNDIFRYNLSRFLLKASDPFKDQLVYDPDSHQVQVVKGPKVYHINIIMRKSFTGPDHQPVVEYKKYRIVLDKDGIKRIEKVS